MTPEELEEEAAWRTEMDGIPRSIINGKIMKYDWELSNDVFTDLPEGDSLDDHIKRLLDGQQG